MNRRGCKVIGGGKTYQGLDFFPAAGGVRNSGLAAHCSTKFLLDDGNTTVNLSTPTGSRCVSHILRNHTYAGMATIPHDISYARDVLVEGAVYDDMVSAAGRGVVESSFPLLPSDGIQSPAWMVNINYGTLQKGASIRVRRNEAKSIRSALVWVQDYSASDLNHDTISLEIVGNRVNFIPVSGDQVYPSWTDSVHQPRFREIIQYDNEMSINGSYIAGLEGEGTICNPNGLLGKMPSGVLCKCGPADWFVQLQPDTVIKIPTGLNRGGLIIKCFSISAVPNNRYIAYHDVPGGTRDVLVNTGFNVTALTGTLTGAAGEAGKINVSVRTGAGVVYLNNRTGSNQRLIFSVNTRL
jgi:hypothetical protein